MVRRPLVSIVTPSLNQGRFLERSIRSIQSQDYQPIEHLIADGGSTDGTIEILRRSEHARWWSEPDAGQSDALNNALARARGEIVGWLNVDDVYVTSAIRIAVDYLISRPDIDLVYGNYFIIDQADALIAIRRAPRFDYAHLLTEHVIAQPTVFFQRRLLERTGGLDPTLHLAMDFDLWLRAGLCGRIAHIPRVLAACRIHPDAKSALHSKDVLNEVLRVLDRAFTNPRLPRQWARLRDAAICAAEIEGGLAAFDAGDCAAARARVSSGLRSHRNPFTRRAIRARLMLVECRTRLPALSLVRRVRRRAFSVAYTVAYPLFARRVGAPRQPASWIHLPD